MIEFRPIANFCPGPNPLHTDSQDFRGRVVSAARELFILKGYEETSMSDVGKALSVSKPTIYECFASKQALMEAVVESAVATLDMTLTRAAARGDVSFEEYINRMPEECSAMALDRNRSAMYRLLIQEGARVPAISTAFASRIATEIYAIYYQLFDRAIKSGECRPLELSVLRRMFMSPVNTLMLQIALSGEASVDPGQTRDFLEKYFEMLRLYLVPPHK